MRLFISWFRFFLFFCSTDWDDSFSSFLLHAIDSTIKVLSFRSLTWNGKIFYLWLPSFFLFIDIVAPSMDRMERMGRELMMGCMFRVAGLAPNWLFPAFRASLATISNTVHSGSSQGIKPADVVIAFCVGATAVAPCNVGGEIRSVIHISSTPLPGYRVNFSMWPAS